MFPNDDTARELAAILGLAPVDRRQAFLAREDADALTRALATYASADDAEDAPLLAFVERVERELGVALDGSGRLKAFSLLVALGVWHPHENLWAHRFGIAPHSADATAHAQTLAEGGFDPSGREDLTGWWTLTIDDADTRDIDDALSVRPRMDGGWTLAIHVADASAWVPPDDALDDEAARRGTSVYAPEAVFAMFPEPLSHEAMSLVAGRARPALSLLIELDDELSVEAWRFSASVVRVDRRLSYDDADHLLETHDLSHAGETVGTLAWMAEERAWERAQRGAVQIELPEARVKVDGLPDDARASLTVVTDTPARLLVAEMMVWYNELAARFLDERGVPVVFRTQESPDQPLDGREVTALPEGPARQFAVLRRMKKGELKGFAAPHFGLGVDHYVQMTSPIRRYSDLVHQRQMLATLRGHSPPYDAQAVWAKVAEVERATWEAQQVERQSRRYWTIWLLARENKVDAVVLEIQDQRAYVFLPGYGMRATARFRKPPWPGDRVRVRVERADPRKDVLMLRLEG